MLGDIVVFCLHPSVLHSTSATRDCLKLFTSIKVLATRAIARRRTLYESEHIFAPVDRLERMKDYRLAMKSNRVTGKFEINGAVPKFDESVTPKALDDLKEILGNRDYYQDRVNTGEEPGRNINHSVPSAHVQRCKDCGLRQPSHGKIQRVVAVAVPDSIVVPHKKPGKKRSLQRFSATTDKCEYEDHSPSVPFGDSMISSLNNSSHLRHWGGGGSDSSILSRGTLARSFAEKASLDLTRPETWSECSFDESYLSHVEEEIKPRSCTGKVQKAMSQLWCRLDQRQKYSSLAAGSFLDATSVAEGSIGIPIGILKRNSSLRSGAMHELCIDDIIALQDANSLKGGSLNGICIDDLIAQQQRPGQLLDKSDNGSTVASVAEEDEATHWSDNAVDGVQIPSEKHTEMEYFGNSFFEIEEPVGGVSGRHQREGRSLSIPLQIMEASVVPMHDSNIVRESSKTFGSRENNSNSFRTISSKGVFWEDPFNDNATMRKTKIKERRLEKNLESSVQKMEALAESKHDTAHRHPSPNAEGKTMHEPNHCHIVYRRAHTKAQRNSILEQSPQPEQQHGAREGYIPVLSEYGRARSFAEHEKLMLDRSARFVQGQNARSRVVNDMKTGPLDMSQLEEIAQLEQMSAMFDQGSIETAGGTIGIDSANDTASSPADGLLEQMIERMAKKYAIEKRVNHQDARLNLDSTHISSEGTLITAEDIITPSNGRKNTDLALLAQYYESLKLAKMKDRKIYNAHAVLNGALRSLDPAVAAFENYLCGPMTPNNNSVNRSTSDSLSEDQSSILLMSNSTPISEEK